MTDQSNRRISSPTRHRDGVRILDIDYYAPFLLSAVSSAWQRQTSAIYRSDFNLGIVDWRVIAMINIEPEITANRICEVIRLDKAAVSRSLKLLGERGLATFEATASDPRRRRWWLTEAGQKVHHDILAIALECEARMLEDIAPEEIEIHLKVMRAMLRNLDK
ncbi:MarR family winged helix-turn-helix transcriptional regulator [Oceanicola sp. S124]|uniref:MarR family winged helix-turn-helix transcriptional regulator n=1 Tax=Oceanicola sp. S124 TaxID=1042378 RepID=UPI00025581C1|nr:MarR family winged helix-turn-helix transcriptional regulator [Oceanicola sp. S124]